MFNLDSLGASLEKSIPKNFGFTLAQLNIISTALQYFRNYISEYNDETDLPDGYFSDIDSTLAKFNSIEFH